MSKKAVRKASKAFYAALNDMARGEVRAMNAAWAHGANVTTMHPVGGREVGWAQVKGPWAQIAALCTGGKVRLRGARLRVGKDLAYEVGNETGTIVLAGRKLAIAHRVTNVYERKKGGWKIVHHHTDLSPQMLEVLGQVSGGGAAAAGAGRPATRRKPPRTRAARVARGDRTP